MTRQRTEPARNRIRIAGLSIALAAAGIFYLATYKSRIDAALCDAVSKDDVERARALLSEGADARGYMVESAGVNPLAELLTQFGRRRRLPASHPQRNYRLQNRGLKPRSLLMGAVEGANTDMVRLLLDRGAALNYALEDGRTALFLCMERNEPDCIAVLVKRGAPVNGRNSAGQAPLHVAARSNSAGNIKTLIDQGAEIEARDGLGQTPLAVAAHYHAGRAVCTLLARGANRAALAPRSTDPPLAWAAAEGDLALVRRLWQSELTPQERIAQCPAALRRAVKGNSVPVVQFLLDHGANVNPDAEKMAKGLPRLRFAPAARTSLLIEVAVDGDRRLFDLLLSRGADPNGRDSNGETPLMASLRSATLWTVLSGTNSAGEHNLRSSAKERIGSIKRLIERGAMVRTANKRGQTPLMLAVGDKDLVDLLLKHGAEVNIRDKFGKTALMLACEDRGISVRRLLDAGAKVNDRDNQGHTPLMYALDNTRLSETHRTVRLLLNHGADPNVRNDRGCNPLSQFRLSARLRSGTPPRAASLAIEAMLINAVSKDDANGQTDNLKVMSH